MGSIRPSAPGAAAHTHPAPWSAMVLAAVVALALRWLAYPGFVGSDGVTYLLSAVKPLDGNWQVDDYVGANRLGVNLPMAAVMALFDRTEAAAAAYALGCSVAEVVLLAWFAGRHLGLRAGVFVGLVMATLPTHVYYAGQMLADPPLALMITGCFVAFFEADRRRSAWGYFLAGAIAGLSFWVKPVTQFVYVVLLLHPLLERRFEWRWLWFVLGMLLLMAANGLAFLMLTGDFWYLVGSIARRRRTGYLAAGVDAGTITTASTVYLQYLFQKIYHTGLLSAWLLLAAWQAARSPRVAARTPRVERYAWFWGLSLLGVLSLLPVRLDPLVLVPKQVNYMLMFMAPLVLLAGAALARLRPAIGTAALAATMASGAVFALLLQADVATFTANSWRTLDWVASQAGKSVHVMSNAIQAGKFEALLQRRDLQQRLQLVRDVPGEPDAQERWAVIDPETLSWDSDRPFASLGQVPACWELVERLQARPAAAGTQMARALLALPWHQAGAAGAAISSRLHALVSPRPTHIYRVPAGC